MAADRKNPLLEKDIHPTWSWVEWRKRWDDCNNAEELIGLLHRGFSLPHIRWEELPERICFYLEIADGWRSESDFYLPGEGRHTSHPNYRHAIALKALKVLCVSVFKNTETDRYHGAPSWAKLVVREEVLKKVFWFFLRENNRPSQYANNLQQENEILFSFLRGLVLFIWEFNFFGKYAGDEDKGVQKMFLKYRPATVQIMYYLHDLDFFLGRKEKIDAKTLEILEHMAMTKLFSNEKRPQSIEEAYHLTDQRSATAKVVLLMRAWQKEHARQEQIEKAEWRMREAQQTLQKLTPEITGRNPHP